MALEEIARAISLKTTPDGGTQTTLGKIMGYGFKDETEAVAFLSGNARVRGHYQGPVDGYIRVRTTDGSVLANAGFKRWSKHTAVELLLEAAIDTGGAKQGDQFKSTLSKAVIEDIAEVANENENDAPVSIEITFRLSRFPGDTADPTQTFEAVAAGP